MNAKKRSTTVPLTECVRTDWVDLIVFAKRGYAWTMTANVFVSVF